MLAVFFALDKGLGILRQVIIARQFGLSPELDAFNAANNLPDLLFALISGGALAIAFIPVLSEYLTQRSRSQAWDLFSRIANLAFVVTAALAVVIAFLAEPIVTGQLGIAPGFNAAQQQLVVSLMRLNLIATLIFSLSGLVMAGLQANQHFFLPALAPLLYNLGQIFGAIILAPQKPYHLGPVSLPAFGLGTYGLVYGVILGAAMHLLIQVPGLVKYRFHWIPSLGLHDPGVKQVLRLLLPRLATMLFIQYYFIARDNLASRLEVGAVTALTYGWMIMQVPETLIGTAIGTALLPTLGEQVARGELAAFRQTVERAMQVLFAITVPVAVVLAIGLGPLVQVAFKFDAQETDLVMWATRAYLAGLMGQSLIEVASRAFYAQQEAIIPLIAAALNAVAYTLLSLVLYRPLGAAGVALANSLAFTGEAALLIYWLRRRLPGTYNMERAPIRAVLGAVSGGAVMFIVPLALPLSSLPSSIVALGLSSLAFLPFIWREIRMLIRL